MANPLKTLLNKKVPASNKDVDFRLLLVVVDKRNLKNKDELNTYLKKRYTVLKDWIRDNSDGATKNDLRRRKAKELDLIKGCKKFIKYI